MRVPHTWGAGQRGMQCTNIPKVRAMWVQVWVHASAKRFQRDHQGLCFPFLWKQAPCDWRLWKFLSHPCLRPCRQHKTELNDRRQRTCSTSAPQNSTPWPYWASCRNLYPRVYVWGGGGGLVLVMGGDRRTALQPPASPLKPAALDTSPQLPSPSSAALAALASTRAHNVENTQSLSVALRWCRFAG